MRVEIYSPSRSPKQTLSERFPLKKHACIFYFFSFWILLSVCRIQVGAFMLSLEIDRLTDLLAIEEDPLLALIDDTQYVQQRN